MTDSATSPDAGGPRSKAEVMAALPPVWPENLRAEIRKAHTASARRLVVLDDDGNVADAYLQVVELRGFERFCVDGGSDISSAAPDSAAPANSPW